MADDTIGRDVAIVRTGIGAVLVPENMAQAIEFAKLMAKSGPAVRKDFRENPGACLAVAMQAARWGFDPYACANKAYFANDSMGYEAQLLAAVVLTVSPIAEAPEYIFEGEGDDMKCKVSVLMKSGKTLTYTSPTIKAMRHVNSNGKSNQNSPLWKSDPQQQLGYYSIRAWARRHQPHVLLGVYDRDELDEMDMRDVTPSAPKTLLQDRLAKATPATEGFSADAGIDTGDVAEGDPPHDPETGEVIEGRVTSSDVYDHLGDLPGTASGHEPVNEIAHERIVDEVVQEQAVVAAGEPETVTSESAPVGITELAADFITRMNDVWSIPGYNKLNRERAEAAWYESSGTGIKGPVQQAVGARKKFLTYQLDLPSSGDTEEIAKRRGASAFVNKMLIRALPGEYREDEGLAKAWTEGWVKAEAEAK